jgi:hypothetical protein
MNIGGNWIRSGTVTLSFLFVGDSCFNYMNSDRMRLPRRVWLSVFPQFLSVRILFNRGVESWFVT